MSSTQLPPSRLLPTTALSCALAAGLALIASRPAQAHFPWLATDDQGHAVLWFGEGLEDRTYHTPEAVADAKVSAGGEEQPLAMKPVNRDDLVGLRGVEPVSREHELSTVVTYGLYHGTKLTYHVEHLPQHDPAAWPSEPRKGAALQTVITPTDEDGVQVTVLRDGKPLAGAEVLLFCDDGHEEGAEETDEQGRVRFDGSQVESGLNAIRVGVTDDQASGQYNGKPYSSTSDFLTATFFAKDEDDSRQKAPASADGAMIRPAKLPPLPEELTSFGAAILDQTLYVYGGHTGQAHSYSTEEQSNRLWSLDLSKGAEASWEVASTGPRLQGLALVTDGEKLVRIGGFTAMNAPGEDHDLQSQADVAAYDPESRSWTELAPLPEPRSSLDAAVHDGRVYVFGGWALSGDSDDPQWHQTAWSLDLEKSGAEWKRLQPMPVLRRAFAAAAWNGRLYVIGGMDESAGPTTEVMVYDPAQDAWSDGPNLPGEGMAGFGAAAFAVGGRLYVSVYDGHLYRLDEAGDGWTSVGKLDTGRFFHRMLPVGKDELLIVGGANMQAGKFTELLKVALR